MNFGRGKENFRNSEKAGSKVDGLPDGMGAVAVAGG